MRYTFGIILSFICFSAGTVEQQPAPHLVPGIVYRDYLITHYQERNRRYSPYLVAVRPLNNAGITVSIGMPGTCRNNFESVIVRDGILITHSDIYYLSENIASMGPSHLDDYINYESADKLFDAKWVNVHPDGKPVEPDGLDANPPNIVWGRRTGLPIPLAPFQPGDTEFVHTAVATAGPRDLLIFDLVRTIPVKGKPAPPLQIKPTRITPEVRARTGAFGIENWGKPEEKKLDGIQAAFAEPFQAYVLGDDYYFLTKSGSLYRSPPPTKGKPRTMSVIWDKAKRPPIRFIISDGNRPGVHFLISYREKVGWKYFRLGGEPKPELLDTDPREGDSPAEVVYELARVLRDKKLIVTPK